MRLGAKFGRKPAENLGNLIRSHFASNYGTSLLTFAFVFSPLFSAAWMFPAVSACRLRSFTLVRKYASTTRTWFGRPWSRWVSQVSSSLLRMKVHICCVSDCFRRQEGTGTLRSPVWSAARTTSQCDLTPPPHEGTKYPDQFVGEIAAST